MNKNIPLRVAGVIFALVALIHLIRLVYQFPISIANHPIRMTASAVGLIVSILLSLWMFLASRK